MCPSFLGRFQLQRLMVLGFESWERCPAPGQVMSRWTGHLLDAINKLGRGLSGLDQGKVGKVGRRRQVAHVGALGIHLLHSQGVENVKRFRLSNKIN
jgi:hypothetical protein